MDKTHIVGAILAGGQSTRMGTDKASLMYQGYTLLDKARNTFTVSQTTKLLISRNTHSNDIHSDLHHNDQIDYIQDVFQDKGPLAGIHACLKNINSLSLKHHMVFMAVDQVSLNETHINKLIQVGLNAHSNAHFSDRTIESGADTRKQAWLPLFIFDTKRAYDALDQILHTNDKLSLGYFIQNVGAIGVNLEDPNALLNINTPQQYQALL